ncbi:nestin [Hyaena hyaena]|uniref:nestin n=1 Tax=Hyaena hyaena TaxID=95912 RepID=UPI001923A679|nr:nestin [Hyaena hyaena]
MEGCLGEESSQMWELNRRLEAYLARVKALEEQNELLGAELGGLRAQNGDASWRARADDELAALRALVDQRWREKHAAEVARDNLAEEVEGVAARCQQQRLARERAAAEAARSRRAAEAERGARARLSSRAAELERELEAARAAHEEERAALSARPRAPRRPAAPRGPPAPAPELAELARRLGAAWRGAVRGYQERVARMEASLGQARERLGRAVQGARDGRLELQQLQAERGGLRERRAALEQRLEGRWQERLRATEQFQVTGGRGRDGASGRAPRGPGHGTGRGGWRCCRVGARCPEKPSWGQRPLTFPTLSGGGRARRGLGALPKHGPREGSGAPEPRPPPHCLDGPRRPPGLCCRSEDAQDTATSHPPRPRSAESAALAAALLLPLPGAGGGGGRTLLEAENSRLQTPGSGVKAPLSFQDPKLELHFSGTPEGRHLGPLLSALSPTPLSSPLPDTLETPEPGFLKSQQFLQARTPTLASTPIPPTLLAPCAVTDAEIRAQDGPLPLLQPQVGRQRAPEAMRAEAKVVIPTGVLPGPEEPGGEQQRASTGQSPSAPPLSPDHPSLEAKGEEPSGSGMSSRFQEEGEGQIWGLAEKEAAVEVKMVNGLQQATRQEDGGLTLGETQDSQVPLEKGTLKSPEMEIQGPLTSLEKQTQEPVGPLEKEGPEDLRLLEEETLDASRSPGKESQEPLRSLEGEAVGVVRPLEKEVLGLLEPGGDEVSQSLQSLGKETRELLRSLEYGNQENWRPLGRENQEPVRPLERENQEPVRPLEEDQETLRPLERENQEPVGPLEEDQETLRPLERENQEPVGPLEEDQETLRPLERENQEPVGPLEEDQETLRPLERENQEPVGPLEEDQETLRPLERENQEPVGPLEEDQETLRPLERENQEPVGPLEEDQETLRPLERENQEPVGPLEEDQETLRPLERENQEPVGPLEEDQETLRPLERENQEPVGPLEDQETLRPLERENQEPVGPLEEDQETLRPLERENQEPVRPLEEDQATLRPLEKVKLEPLMSLGKDQEIFRPLETENQQLLRFLEGSTEAMRSLETENLESAQSAREDLGILQSPETQEPLWSLEEKHQETMEPLEKESQEPLESTEESQESWRSLGEWNLENSRPPEEKGQESQRYLAEEETLEQTENQESPGPLKEEGQEWPLSAPQQGRQEMMGDQTPYQEMPPGGAAAGKEAEAKLDVREWGDFTGKSGGPGARQLATGEGGSADAGHPGSPQPKEQRLPVEAAGGEGGTEGFLDPAGQGPEQAGPPGLPAPQGVSEGRDLALEGGEEALSSSQASEGPEGLDTAVGVAAAGSQQGPGQEAVVPPVGEGGLEAERTQGLKGLAKDPEEAAALKPEASSLPGKSTDPQEPPRGREDSEPEAPWGAEGGFPAESKDGPLGPEEAGGGAELVQDPPSPRPTEPGFPTLIPGDAPGDAPGPQPLAEWSREAGWGWEGRGEALGGAEGAPEDPQEEGEENREDSEADELGETLPDSTPLGLYLRSPASPKWDLLGEQRLSPQGETRKEGWDPSVLAQPGEEEGEGEEEEECGQDSDLSEEFEDLEAEGSLLPGGPGEAVEPQGQEPQQLLKPAAWEGDGESDGFADEEESGEEGEEDKMEEEGREPGAGRWGLGPSVSTLRAQGGPQRGTLPGAESMDVSVPWGDGLRGRADAGEESQDSTEPSGSEEESDPVPLDREDPVPGALETGGGVEGTRLEVGGTLGVNGQVPSLKEELEHVNGGVVNGLEQSEGGGQGKPGGPQGDPGSPLEDEEEGGALKTAWAGAPLHLGPGQFLKFGQREGDLESWSSGED